MNNRIVTMGEIMLRLKSPGVERFFQTPYLEATFGGGEANVAVSLARFGSNVAFFTILPNNPIADACIQLLRSYGVDTSLIQRAGERIGIYFLETGANQRPSIDWTTSRRMIAKCLNTGCFVFTGVLSSLHLLPDILKNVWL